MRAGLLFPSPLSTASFWSIPREVTEDLSVAGLIASQLPIHTTAMKPFHRLASQKALTGLAVSRALPLQTFATNRSWQRSFSVTSAAASKLAGLDASKLTISKTTTPKEITSPKDLVFGKTFTGKSGVEGVNVCWSSG